MAESQSRFSIIDELIEKKAETTEKILVAEKSVTDAEFENEEWEIQVLRGKEQRAKNMEKLKKDSEKLVASLKQVLEEYDKGLTAVQEISKEQK